MTIEQALNSINALRSQLYSYRSKLTLGRWTELLEELDLLLLQPEEKRAIEQELDIHLHQIKMNLTRKILKERFKLFLRFLKDQLNIQSFDYVVGIGVIAGFFVSGIAGINFFWGLLGGLFLGHLAKQYVAHNSRIITTDLYNLW
ncbi:MAG: hypothetical protein WBA16_02165 [Nonlabens sp.]